jgi:hypothetical protein
MMDEVEKKARLKAWREREREAARSAVPLPDCDMEALFDMLDSRLPDAGCDHSLRLTDAWLAEKGHSVDEVHRWLDQNGGFCDCEVLANSEEAWRAAASRR